MQEKTLNSFRESEVWMKQREAFTNELHENGSIQWQTIKEVKTVNVCEIMKLKVIATSRVYQQLFILILLLQNSVSGQIDWAEDDDDPGEIDFHLPQLMGVSSVTSMTSSVITNWSEARA